MAQRRNWRMKRFGNPFRCSFIPWILPAQNRATAPLKKMLAADGRSEKKKRAKRRTPGLARVSFLEKEMS